MACTSGCPTQDCGSYAACLRRKSTGTWGVNISNGFEATKQTRWDRDLSAYRDARDSGIQPSGTDRESVDRALRLSDAVGAPWQAGGA